MLNPYLNNKLDERNHEKRRSNLTAKNEGEIKTSCKMDKNKKQNYF
jgi:hypothetical protein